MTPKLFLATIEAPWRAVELDVCGVTPLGAICQTRDILRAYGWRSLADLVDITVVEIG